ncbi:DUF5701 family protein [Blastococcus jejuensis]|uniref:DUF5701 family protein n=1 Tax=Blastococcus jejuensis TaxID=351224 RepID=A0ABP6PI51_9ACTN
MSALSHVAAPTETDLEFDRQVDALVATGLPERLDLADGCFRAWLEPLRDQLPAVGTPGEGIPFVVVLPDLPVVDVLATVHMVGGAGFTTMEPDDLARFRPLPELDVPSAPYLLLDVDPGPDTLNQPPVEALPQITAAGRSPLTIAEGVSVLVSDPGVLRSRNCFSLLGSRAGDKRVPALWVSARRPRLGWCYQGAPHTWLGSASCGGRVAEPPRAV